MAQRCNELILRSIGGLDRILFPLNQALAFAYGAVRLPERETYGVDLAQSLARQSDGRAAVANASREQSQLLHGPDDAISDHDGQHEGESKGGKSAETYEPRGVCRTRQHDLARRREADRPVAQHR